MNNTFTNKNDSSEEYVIRASQESDVNMLAGSIAIRLRSQGTAIVQTIGANAVNQAIKAIITARRYLEPTKQDLTIVPEFKVLELKGYGEKTAIRFTITIIDIL